MTACTVGFSTPTEFGKLINDIAKICSGGGGGKPNFAQAGAKDIDKLNLALEYARNDLFKKLRSYSDK